MTHVIRYKATNKVTVNYHTEEGIMTSLSQQTVYILPDERCPKCEALLATDGRKKWCINDKCKEKQDALRRR